MRLTGSDPDIETIVGRIKDGSLDLQPNFQRGEVWSIPKKQRLIDSVLRDWHIPPIHVVVDQSNRHLVLDGQQRLVAIRDFVNGEFPVDGMIQPNDDGIASLDGVFYADLPEEWRRRFNQFTLRLFRITDYKPSEPGELFFRLNQLSALTSAEQRNAFFGDTREQVKNLVNAMESHGLNMKFWGFSNARMAYDDIIARTCLALENRTLKKKITANALADRYRTGRGFSAEVEGLVKSSIQLLGTGGANSSVLSFNKATAQTWLVFAATLIQGASHPVNSREFHQFIKAFADMRLAEPLGLELDPGFGDMREMFGPYAAAAAVNVYEDRSTSRVADISSVTLRDFVLWLCYWSFAKSPLTIRQLQLIENAAHHQEKLATASDVEALASKLNWGDLY